MTDPLTPSLTGIDIHKILEQQRQVAIIWSIEDVQILRPDLTDDQSWEVLQSCYKWYDCGNGFTWDYIEFVAESHFPLPEDDEAGSAVK